jgi:secreted trypsin-like serine protease
MARIASIALSFAFAASQISAAGASEYVTDPRASVLQSAVFRIVGGELAPRTAWPWQIVLYVKRNSGNFSMACGGSLIHPGWVLTAAHCVNSLSPDDYAIVEGTTRIDPLLKKSGPGRVIPVRRVVRHEDYNPGTKENDVALLELAVPARLAKPVRLSFPEKSLLEAPGTNATVTGWGTLQFISREGLDTKTGEVVKADDPKYYTNDLMQVEIPLVAEQVCQQSYRDLKDLKIDRRVVCAGLPEGGKDSCQGDSGGPLVAKAADGSFRQIGVVSFGRECAAKEAYGVYTKVSAFESWLQQNTKIAFAQDAPPPPPPVDVPGGPPAPINPVTNAAGLVVSFAQGDTLKTGQVAQFKVTTAKPGYLVLIDLTPAKKMVQIYPNAKSLSSPTGGAPMSNYVEPGRVILVPDPKNPYEGFQFRVDPPAGEGLLVAILSAEPLKSVSMPSGPTAFETEAQALDFLAKVTDELGRSIEIIPVGPAAGAGPTAGTANGKPRDWSFATKTYRIVQ